MFYEISKIQLIGVSRLRVMAISLSRVIQLSTHIHATRLEINEY